MKALVMLLAGLCLAAGAAAQTFADVSITHVLRYVVTPTGNVIVRDEDLSFGVRVDTDAESAAALFEDTGRLVLGQTTVTVYDYTITLSNLGRPYPGPRTTYCTPIAFESQCMEPFGAEGTFAQILAGHRDPRSANPFIDISRDGVTLTAAGRQPQQLVQSGQLTTVASANDTAGEFGTEYGVLVFVNAFAAPIPELSTAISMLAGLLLLGAVTTSRSRIASGLRPRH